MVTIKSFTSIEQSRKLAEILPLESADMVYTITNGYHTPWIRIEKIDELDKDDVCAWSLAALLDVIPCGQVNRMANSDKWEASSWNDSDFEPAYYVENYDNPVDACVAMIERLHELKML